MISGVDLLFDFGVFSVQFSLWEDLPPGAVSIFVASDHRTYLFVLVNVFQSNAFFVGIAALDFISYLRRPFFFFLVVVSVFLL